MKSRRNYRYANILLTIKASEISAHYELVKAKSNIKLDQIHPTWRPDLEGFLSSNGIDPKRQLVPLKNYKQWLKKNDNQGLDYSIRVDQT